MAQREDSEKLYDYQGILIDDPEFLKGIVREFLQQYIEAEASRRLGAERYERTEGRQGYRNGSYNRTLKTRVGRIELSVPRDREGKFHTELFFRYQRSEQSFLMALMEMSVMGVSTRKISKITEELCGTSFSKSFVSSLSSDLDNELSLWRNRELDGNWPYLYVDALYEKVRIKGRVVSKAVMIVVGVNEDGHRSILAVEVSESENTSDYGMMFENLIARGLRGVQLVISDDHPGLVNAVKRHFQGASWQRCQVHFIRNLLQRLRKSDRPVVLGYLQDIFQAPDRAQAESRLGILLNYLEARNPELAVWIDENIQDTLTVFDFPAEHFRRIRSTNGLERFNEEIRRRTRVIRIFPNTSSCLRLASALCQEQDEEWSTGKRYLDMTLLNKSSTHRRPEKIRQVV